MDLYMRIAPELYHKVMFNQLDQEYINRIVVHKIRDIADLFSVADGCDWRNGQCVRD